MLLTVLTHDIASDRSAGWVLYIQQRSRLWLVPVLDVNTHDNFLDNTQHRRVVEKQTLSGSKVELDLHWQLTASSTLLDTGDLRQLRLLQQHQTRSVPQNTSL
jgi:hypothetical protein